MTSEFDVSNRPTRSLGIANWGVCIFFSEGMAAYVLKTGSLSINMNEVLVADNPGVSGFHRVASLGNAFGGFSEGVR